MGNRQPWHCRALAMASRLDFGKLCHLKRDCRTPLISPLVCLSTYLPESKPQAYNPTETMEIWPAIDLLGGKCVRLQQGDYARETVFSDHPAEMAKRWFDAGAEFLHCVDLDGAKTGSLVNEQAVRGIVEVASGKTVQLGGGVRDESVIRRLLDLGLSRLVVGTAALRQPDWFAKMCEEFPGKLVLGVDARGGMVATEGWLETSSTPATELINRIGEKTRRCAAVVYTDIEKDGMMAGPNFASLLQIEKCSPFPVIASGGVSSLEDLRKLAAQGTAGAIVGRALYDGAIRLEDALEIGRSTGRTS